MRKAIPVIAVTAAILCSLTMTASAHGGHHRAARQCSSSTCSTSGVCDGSCNGTGSCRNYDGCNYSGTYHHSHHGHC